MAPIDFQVPWKKFKVKLLVFVKLMSSQYLFTPSLENCQTWYSEVDDPLWFWGHVVKGQGKTANLWENLFAMSLDSFAGRCRPWFMYSECLFRIDFQVTWSKVKVTQVVFVQIMSTHISWFLSIWGDMIWKFSTSLDLHIPPSTT